MPRNLIIILAFFSSSYLLAQVEDSNVQQIESPSIHVDVPQYENRSNLKTRNSSPTIESRLKRLEEIEVETTRILKSSIKDIDSDQASRGFIELNFGLSYFKPQDVEDANDRIFQNLEHASWDEFGNAKILEVMIGKKIQSNLFIHEFGIGYQYVHSKADASFQLGSNRINVYEKFTSNVFFIRYTPLFIIPELKKLKLGPGFSLGYSPSNKLSIDVRNNHEGVQVIGESDSLFLELFFKSEIEIARYVSINFYTGYRYQKSEELRLSAADFISIKRDIELDSSGMFAKLGFLVSF